MKLKHRGVVHSAIGQWVEEFERGKITPENIQDLEKLIKLDLLLIGEPTERGEQVVAHDFDDKTIEAAYDLLYRGHVPRESTDE